MKSLFYFFIGLAVWQQTNAQATFFKNLNNTSATNLGIGVGIEYNGYHYFNASFEFTEDALWRTDGTSANTEIVAQFNTYSAFVPIVEFNNELYYTAVVDPAVGGVLVKTDGTSPGTVIADLKPGNGIAFTNAKVLSTGLFFVRESSLGAELYVTDGTAAGVTIVKDIFPGIGSSSPSFMTKFNDQIIFRADDGVHGTEVWVSDGTEAGTFRLTDINPNGNSFVNSFTTLGNRVMFKVNGDLWSTDGTVAGTQLVADLNIDSESLYVYQNEIYFSAFDITTLSNALYKSDGTTAGTVLLASGLNDVINTFQSTNNLLFFVGSDEDHGTELWKTDGTAAGTSLVADLFPGEDGAFGSSPELGNGGDVLFFTGYFTDDPNLEDEWNGELWSSDGTEVGTGLHTTINDGPADASISDFFNINDRLLFKADEFNNQGIDLWVTNAVLLNTTTKSIPEVVLYPNPVNDIFHIETQTPEAHTATLYSYNGVTIGVYDNEKTINLSGIASGIYLLKISFENGSQLLEKVIKR